MLTDTQAAVDWLKQFRSRDQAIALRLLRALTLVSHEDLDQGLTRLVRGRAAKANGTIGLFVEREIRSRYGIPNRLFKESRSKPKRAFGIGPPVVAPVRAYEPDVGSEGVIATIASALARADRRKFVVHPGPDKIRGRNINRLFILTDFIGTGHRAFKFLESAWRVASVKSWWSLGLIRFEVLAYSATTVGQRLVESHACQPIVKLVVPCPTIETEFAGYERAQMRQLCIHNDPIDHDKVESLGYGGTGALIVFGHSAPNNMPRIFFHGGARKRWTPLFPARVTTELIGSFGRKKAQRSLAERLRAMRQVRLSEGQLVQDLSSPGKELLLVLAALARPPRWSDVIARRTGLTILEVEECIEQAMKFSWLDSRSRLTEAGHRQLVHARSRNDTSQSLVSNEVKPYYPKALRAPGKSFSAKPGEPASGNQ